MTYEELEKMNKDLDKQVDKLYRQQTKNELKYIAEHEPFKVHRYQILNVRLRVTEETRNTLTDAALTKKKYQLGHEYTVTGCFIGWHIREHDGELRPCFFGGTTYSRFDEIVSIESAEQIEGHCSKCLKYKDGYCYLAGGKDISVKCATHKVKKDDYTCPKYEELTELWEKHGEHRHIPNVTICKHHHPIGYRIYALNWGSFCEWSQDVIDSNYTFENPNK